MTCFAKTFATAAFLLLATTANAEFYFESFGDPLRCEPPLGCGSVFSENFWHFHRFQVEEDNFKLEKIGGVFTSSNFQDLTAFGAIVQLTGAEDFPDSVDLSTNDVLGVSTFEILSRTKNADFTAEFNMALDPGWYAMGFGMGRFGASSLMNSTVYMPSYLTDLSPDQYTFSAIQSSGTFVKNNFHTIETEPRLYVIGSGLPVGPSIIAPTPPQAPNRPVTPSGPAAPTPPGLGNLFSPSAPNSPFGPSSPVAPTPPHSVVAAAETGREIQHTTNPEPGTIFLFGLGMGGALMSRRKRR